MGDAARACCSMLWTVGGGGDAGFNSTSVCVAESLGLSMFAVTAANATHYRTATAARFWWTTSLFIEL